MEAARALRIRQLVVKSDTAEELGPVLHELLAMSDADTTRLER